MPVNTKANIPVTTQPAIKSVTQPVKTVPVVSKITNKPTAASPVQIAKTNIPESKVGPITLPSSIPSDVATLISQHKQNPKWGDYKGNYFVYSKENSTFYVLNNKHQIIDSIIGGRGMDKGDDKNTFLESSQDGRKTTPSGNYAFKFIDNTKDEQKDYSSPFYGFNNDQYGQLGVHGIYKGNFNYRKQILDDPKVKQKLFSYGCINIPKEFLSKYPPVIGDSLFITKEPKI